MAPYDRKIKRSIVYEAFAMGNLQIISAGLLKLFTNERTNGTYQIIDEPRFKKKD